MLDASSGLRGSDLSAGTRFPHQYSLTQLGRTLIAPLRGMCRWAKRYCRDVSAKRAPSGKPKWPKARIFVGGRILRAGPSVIANRKQIEAAMIERRIVMNIANKTVLITGASRGI